MAKGDMNVKVGVDTQPLEQGLTKSKALLLGFAGGIGAAVGGIVAGAIRNVGSFITESVRMAGTEIQAQNQLLVALKGRVGAQQELIAQAKELQKTTIFGDDETVKAQAMLAAFVKDEQQIKKLIPLVQDLAAAKGMDLAQAADLVGRSVGTSTYAMSRYGIKLEGAAGSAERTDIAVRRLSDAFGGQAEAAAKVGLGPLQQLQNAWGDIREELGAVLLPVLAKVAGWLADKLPKVIDGAKTAWANLRLAVANVSKTFAIAYEDVKIFGRYLLNPFAGAGKKAEWAVEYAESVGKIRKSYEDTVASIKAKPLQDQVDAPAVTTSLNETAGAAKEVSKAFLEQADAYELAQLQLSTYKQFLDSMTEAVASRVLPVSQELADAWAEQGEELAALEPEVEAAIEAYKKLDSNLNGVKDSVEELNSSLNNISEQALEGVIGLVAEQAGQLAAGATTIQQASKAIMFAIADFLEQFGKALIAYGISVEAFKKAFANPVAAVIAGAALIGTAAIARSILERGAQVPALASGGLAYKPTLAMVGDNPNAGSDPEVIAPLSKLAGILGKNRGDVNVRGKLVGNDIYITNERQYNRIQRINGF